jgi:hypothetical protein
MKLMDKWDNNIKMNFNANDESEWNTFILDGSGYGALGRFEKKELWS